MRNRTMNPVIAQKIHLYIKDKKVYGMTLNDSNNVKEIDFEEDEWRHDCQCSVDASAKLLFDMSKFEELKDDEEILPHYIVQMNATQFLVFPLKEAVFLQRGILVESATDKAEAKVIKTFADSPSISGNQLLRPGICPQTQNNVVKSIMFIDGNDQKKNHLLNLETNTWSEAGLLPNFHIVTEQITVLHNEKQTFTVFSQVNFDQNKFEIVMASNKGNLAADFAWEHIYKESTDIANFHIKSAIMVGDYLVITSRGKPRDTFEQCVSFLLFMKSKQDENGIIIGFEPDYNVMKLDHLVYPQLNTPPTVRFGQGSGDYCNITVV